MEQLQKLVDIDKRNILKNKLLRCMDTTTGENREFKKTHRTISPENAIERNLRMEATNYQTTINAALFSAVTKLKKLNFALTTIKTSKLMLMPESNNCVRCAARF